MHIHCLGIYSMSRREFYSTFIVDDYGNAVPTSSQTFHALGLENQLSDAIRWSMWTHRLSCKY